MGTCTLNSYAYSHVCGDKSAHCILLLTNRNTLSADELSADDVSANKQAVIGKQLQEHYHCPAEHSLVTISVPLSHPFTHYPFVIHAHTHTQCLEGCLHPSINFLLLIRIIRSQTSFSPVTFSSSSWGIPRPDQIHNLSSIFWIYCYLDMPGKLPVGVN